MQIERVGVVGCGLMGSGIAEVSARAGLNVVVVDASDAAVKAGRERIESSLANAVRRGKLDAESQQRALEALTFSTDMDALADRQLVVEAVTEAEKVKTAIFRSLDDIVEDPEAILASNTSSIPIMKLGMSTRRPEYVVGLHFFNPVPVL
ncbi:MAG: 3-hydroxyacyl-CoA dehydrogenase NAD-binding domain-containing protein, partial [Ilumatobacteraceae bacterium]